MPSAAASRRLAALLLAAACAAVARSAPAADLAAAPRLVLPIRCTPGSDCFIQNHFDHDAGPGWRDYACGHLAYDGHEGTDFRVRSLAEMAAGVEVLAAADGVVVATRDGEPDVSVRERGRENLAGRLAGNGVRIDHGAGWQTQYNHLRRGSVRVQRGQRVAAGEVLGLVGLSGNTEFPHLDFVVSRRARAIDPFVPGRGSGDAGCPTAPAPDTLWRDEVAAVLGYRPAGVLIAGFAGESPDRRKAQQGGYRGAVAPDAPLLSFWIEVFGPRAGDVERIALLAPDGATLARREQTVDRSLAVRYAYVGRRRGAQPWPAGTYVARYRLERDARVVAQTEVRVEIR